MHRTLLVAEGTLHRPVANSLAVVAGSSVTLLLGLAIIRSGLPLWASALGVIALLVAVSVVNARFGGPREFRIEKHADDAPLRVVGRFDNGEIRSAEPAELGETRIEDGRLCLHVTTKAGSRELRLSPPAFSSDSLATLRDAIETLRDTPREELQARHSQSRTGLRVYDAKQLLLLRFTQKPGYMLILWLISAATVMAWLLLAALVPI